MIETQPIDPQLVDILRELVVNTSAILRYFIEGVKAWHDFIVFVNSTKVILVAAAGGIIGYIIGRKQS
ncbi:MAG: hypothetical protein QXU32_06905 [Nitrososphaerales archaeon]